MVDMDFRVSLEKHFGIEKAESIYREVTTGKLSHALIINPKKMSDEAFLRAYPDVKRHPFVPHAFLYEKEKYDFGKKIIYDAGAISIQDAAAMMAVYFLNPKKEDTILDMCAAPGGKSIEASILMEDEGTIVANDISYPRAKALSQNVERMGRGNIIVSSNDFVFSYTNYAGRFDKILIDAPCSGSMMYRKNAEAKTNFTPAKISGNAHRQIELLELGYKMLKPGGDLVYSTCSFSKEENEDVIEVFRRSFPEVEVVPLPEDPTFYHPEALKEAVYLLPDRFYGEGQFVCLLHKPGIHTPDRPVEKAEEGVASRYRGFLEHYGLLARSNEMFRKKFYSIDRPFDASHLNLLRYGVKLFEIRDSLIYLPDHHLAAFLDSSYSVAIGKEDAKKYIRGETFLLDRRDDFYIVSYEGLNLGFVKVSGGIAKNHYPRGLRREWDPDNE